ncbi:hypothetical protein OH809_15685 [Streptomyces sp. NBC_00873]|uniref:hypothetical protein n=1 Tax=unclassified Streptomyces TaxID=2593676 RepID=UPI00386C969F|nr:hypothetical protein OH809_15685 [Streptomyces sp. NBC_00873]WTA45995.1 hypothetical protein OH821_27995 [Streptomyces sp. NBC_00842]
MRKPRPTAAAFITTAFLFLPLLGGAATDPGTDDLPWTVITAAGDTGTTDLPWTL